jgi:hypothetical protein
MHAYVYSTELHVLHACSCQVLCLFVRCTPIFDFCIFTEEGAVTCLISRPNIKGFSYLRHCNFSSLPLQFYSIALSFMLFSTLLMTHCQGRMHTWMRMGR